MRDYQCMGNDHINLSELFADKTVVSGCLLYEPEMIADVALRLKEQLEDTICKLPFDHVLEAESLGGRPFFDKERMELRLSQPTFKKVEDIKELPSINFQNGRIHQVLTAAEILIAKGEPVVLNISGPMTILNGLVPVEEIFRSFRKTPDLMDEIMTKLTREILNFVLEGQRRGMKRFSYADPLGGLSIVGPNLLNEMIQRYIYPLLKQIYNSLNEDEMLILCPKTALPLVDMGIAQTRTVRLPQSMSYQDAILCVQGKCKVVGLRCMNQSTKEGLSDSITELIL